MKNSVYKLKCILIIDHQNKGKYVKIKNVKCTYSGWSLSWTIHYITFNNWQLQPYSQPASTTGPKIRTLGRYSLSMISWPMSSANLDECMYYLRWQISYPIALQTLSMSLANLLGMNYYTFCNICTYKDRIWKNIWSKDHLKIEKYLF